MRKASDRFFIKSAALQILSRPRAFGTLQAFLKECGGSLLNIQQLSPELRFFRLCRTRVRGLGQRNPQLLSYQTHSFRER